MRHFRLIFVLGIFFVSFGCGSAGKSFNSSKVESIVNGTTSKVDLKKMFGEPFKIGIQNGQPIWIYEDHHYSAIGNEKSKDLIIIFGPDGLVKSYQFMTTK